MFANDLTLDKVDGTDVVYRLIKNLTDGSLRTDIAASSGEPRQMKIGHSSSGKAPLVRDRHVVQFTDTIDAVPTQVQPTAYVVFDIPRNPAVTAQVMYDLACHIIDFLSSGAATGLASTANLEALFRGES
jgi:hypothetical protein